MQKVSQATVDGTFEGPDAMAELIAMHLHRLGAAKAKSVTFVADGATWIWDRIPDGQECPSYVRGDRLSR